MRYVFKGFSRFIVLFAITILITSLNYPIAVFAEKNSNIKTQQQDRKDTKSDEDILDDIKDKSKNEFDKILDSADDIKNLGESVFWIKFMKVHTVFKEFAPIVIILSVTFGAIIVFFARLNKALRRWAIGALLIGIPLVTLICVYGMPYIHYVLS